MNIWAFFGQNYHPKTSLTLRLAVYLTLVPWEYWQDIYKQAQSAFNMTLKLLQYF